MEENVVIKKMLKNIVLIVTADFMVGIIFGIIIWNLTDVSYTPKWVSDNSIFINNITELGKVLKYSFLSFGVYALIFLYSLGKTFALAVCVIVDNYSIIAVIKGFLPHAIVETSCCFISSVVPVYIWYNILELVIRKNVHKNKKSIILKGSIAIVIMLVSLVLLCLLAAYLEENISEVNFFYQH